MRNAAGGDQRQGAVAGTRVAVGAETTRVDTRHAAGADTIPETGVGAHAGAGTKHRAGAEPGDGGGRNATHGAGAAAKRSDRAESADGAGPDGRRPASPDAGAMPMLVEPARSPRPRQRPHSAESDSLRVPSPFLPWARARPMVAAPNAKSTSEPSNRRNAAVDGHRAGCAGYPLVAPDTVAPAPRSPQKCTPR
jgi:hypothetical protein